MGFFQGETFKAREDIVDIPIDDALIMHRLQAWMMKESGHEHFILITWSMNSFPFVQSQLLPYFQRNAQLGSTSFNLDRVSNDNFLL